MLSQDAQTPEIVKCPRCGVVAMFRLITGDCGCRNCRFVWTQVDAAIDAELAEIQNDGFKLRVQALIPRLGIFKIMRAHARETFDRLSKSTVADRPNVLCRRLCDLAEECHKIQRVAFAYFLKFLGAEKITSTPEGWRYLGYANDVLEEVLLGRVGHWLSTALFGTSGSLQPDDEAPSWVFTLKCEGLYDPYRLGSQQTWSLYEQLVSSLRRRFRSTAHIMVAEQYLVSLSVEQDENARNLSAIVTTKPLKPVPKKKKSKAQLRREQIIFGAIQNRLKGPKYCGELDRKKLPMPPSWKADDCPDSYVLAYKKGPLWQKRIQDEKHRYQKKFDRLVPAEREKIIAGEATGTRSPRS